MKDLYVVRITYQAYVLAESYANAASDYEREIVGTEMPRITAHRAKSNELGWDTSCLVYHSQTEDIKLSDVLPKANEEAAQGSESARSGPTATRSPGTGPPAPATPSDNPSTPTPAWPMCSCTRRRCCGTAMASPSPRLPPHGTRPSRSKWSIWRYCHDRARCLFRSAAGAGRGSRQVS